MRAAAPEGFADAVAAVELGGGADVVEDAHRAEEPDVLEGAGHAAFGEHVRFHAGGGFSVEGDLAFGRLIDAGDHVEDGGLARAVGADEADQLALADFQAHVADRRQAAEADGDIFEFQQGLAHGFTANGFFFRSKLNSPCGRAIIMKMMSRA